MRYIRLLTSMLSVPSAHDPEVSVYDGTTVRRQLFDGSAHRVVKVPHAPGELERRLRSLGWRVRVTQARGPFFWGVGARV